MVHRKDSLKAKGYSVVVKGHGFSRAVRDVKNEVPRRYGATTRKPDSLVAVASHGRVGGRLTQITARLKPMPLQG